MLKTGKLPNELLQEMIQRYIKPQRSEVIMRPSVGEDCAVIDFGDYDCHMSTDPITAATTQIGSLAVHVSCNDIASNGVSPLGIMLTLLLPEGTTEAEVEEIMRNASEAASLLNVEIIGGHTEVTQAVNKPVIVSTAIGQVKKNDYRKEELKPGDIIYMTKTAGLEGTGIIASEHRDALSEVLTGEEFLQAERMLGHVSVVREGVIAGMLGFSVMHDVTEGGVLGALWGICQGNGVGAVIYEQKIPVEDVTGKICDHFGLDPFKLISSGAMLIAVRPEKSNALERGIADAGIRLSKIGEVCDAAQGICMVSKTEAVSEISSPGSDELYMIKVNQ
jgi:hydrogenase expression/formation protein HypE